MRYTLFSWFVGVTAVVLAIGIGYLERSISAGLMIFFLWWITMLLGFEYDRKREKYKKFNEIQVLLRILNEENYLRLHSGQDAVVSDVERSLNRVERSLYGNTSIQDGCWEKHKVK